MSPKLKTNLLTKATFFGSEKVTLYSLDGVTWSSRADELEVIKERHEAQRITIAQLKGEKSKEAKGGIKSEEEEKDTQESEDEEHLESELEDDIVLADDPDDEENDEEEVGQKTRAAAKGKANKGPKPELKTKTAKKVSRGDSQERKSGSANDKKSQKHLKKAVKPNRPAKAELGGSKGKKASNSTKAVLANLNKRGNAKSGRKSGSQRAAA